MQDIRMQSAAPNPPGKHSAGFDPAFRRRHHNPFIRAADLDGAARAMHHAAPTTAIRQEQEGRLTMRSYWVPACALLLLLAGCAKAGGPGSMSEGCAALKRQQTAMV